MLLMFMCATICFSKLKQYYQGQSLAFDQKYFDLVPVTIEGEVQKPNTYFVLPGTPLLNVVKKAKPLPSSKYQKISENILVDQPHQLYFEKIPEIQVQIEGAVLKKAVLTLPVESRICDLADKIQLSSDADPRFLKRKKMLFDGEIITIPKKTVE